jgi:DNA polymerase-3 subunit chi
MTRIDFYVVPPSEEDSKDLAACRLTQKAYRLKHRIYILTENADQSTHLDRLLWTFNPGSFIPHQVHADTVDPRLPVLIGHDVPPTEFNDVLISLAPKVPEFFARFARVAELVGAPEADRAAARERFRIYRDRGFAVETHNL